MNICKRGHAEIVYEDFHCPLCMALAGEESKTDEINSLEEEIGSLTHEILSLEERLAALKKSLA